jgi:hypothetical protein
MTTISPSPFPADGVRKLSVKEALQRVKALSYTLPKDNRPTCSGQVFVGLFFDGTGNNMTLDYGDAKNYIAPEKRKHSNIVKLFQTHRFEPQNGYFRFYMPGVGTPFPEIGDNNKYLFDKNRGAIGAEKGEHRILWAFTQLLNAPHLFVTKTPLIPDDQAQKLVDSLAGYDATVMDMVRAGIYPTAALFKSLAEKRRDELNAWQDKLKAKLAGKKPGVEQINVSVFGFSRGAAEARAFVNWLFEVCKQEGGGWTFAGLPIRVQFLGIFDTVASVGLTNLFDNDLLAGHQSWADDNLEIHPGVEQCVHYVAGHEVRACFPADSVRVKSHYPANTMEVMYPGAHSDVGGGYAPGALGVSPTQESSMSIIPGANMYQEARKAGVPLLPFATLRKEFIAALTPSDSVINDFNAYLKHANVGSGPVEDMHRRHMALYFSYRFKHRHKFSSRAPFSTATDEKHDDRKTDKDYLNVTHQCLIERLACLGGDPMKPDFNPARAADIGVDRIMQNINARDAAAIRKEVEKVTPADIAKAAAAATTTVALTPGAVAMAAVAAPVLIASRNRIRAQRLYEVAKSIDTGKVTPEIDQFFDRYIHDSMAGFIGMGMNEYALNGIGFVKFRTVFKGNDFSISKAIGDKAGEAKKAAGEAYDATAQKLQETADAAANKAKEAADYARKKAQEATDYAQKKALETRNAAVAAYDATAKAIQDEAIAAQKKAAEAADYARKKAQEAADYTKKKAQETQQGMMDGAKLFWNGNVWVAERLLKAVISDAN